MSSREPSARSAGTEPAALLTEVELSRLSAPERRAARKARADAGIVEPARRQFGLELDQSNFTISDGTQVGPSARPMRHVEIAPDGPTIRAARRAEERAEK